MEKRTIPLIQFSLLDDTDKHFKEKLGEIMLEILRKTPHSLEGKLGETIFENLQYLRPSALARISDFLSSVEYCSTRKIRRFLQNPPSYYIEEYGEYIKPVTLTNVKLALREIRKNFYKFKKKVGITRGKKRITSVDIRGGSCILCGSKKKSVCMPKFDDYLGDFRELWFCRKCLEKCVKSKVISKNKEHYTLETEDLYDLCLLDILTVLSKLNRAQFNFIKKIYQRLGSGHEPFDYICVDKKGNKFLMDVSSSIGKRTGEPSNREKSIMKEATKIGFKILVLEVYFRGNWRVEIKLNESSK